MFPTEYQEPTYNTAIQVVQMLRLLDEKPSGEMKVAEIAEILDVHPRTVKRYIEAVGGVISTDAKPYIERVRHGRTPYAKVNRALSDDLTVTLFEYAAMRLATASMMASMPDTFGYLHEKASERMQATVSKEVSERIRDFEDAFVYVPYGPKHYDAASDLVIKKAIDAVVKRYPATITYRSLSSEGVKSRNIQPYSIVLYRDALYIYARQQKPRLKGNSFRYFAVDRIASFDLHVDKTFRKSKTFDASELGKHSLGIWDQGEPERVVLRFFDDGAQYVREREWPNQERLDEISDREVVLEMSIPITPEVIAWLAGWGACVEVVEPADLVDSMRDYLADALDHYV